MQLEELVVSNLGLIGSAHIEPGPGLVIITGETGTGKTMLLGALDLLLGRTASSDSVGPAGEEASVQGRFRDGETEQVASRRVLGGGRSRAYLDSDLVPARVLGETLGDRVEVIRQGDARRLADPAAFRQLVDMCLDADGVAAYRAYRQAWSALTDLRDRQSQLGGDLRALERELDMASHQAAEIEAAGFEPGEDRELETRADRLRHAVDLAEALSQAHASLENQDQLATAVGAIRQAAGFDPSLADLREQLDALQSLWSDALTEVRTVAGEIEHNPAALAEVEERLNLLGDLRRKYGPDLDAVLAFGTEAAIRADSARSLLATAGEIDALLTAAETDVREAAEGLRAARRRAGKELAERAAAHLRDLGFGEPVVQVEIEPGEAGPNGADRTRLLFASDSALSPAPAHKSASGGELSRLILATRLAAGAADAAMIVFDEVDAGIGGATALAMGEKLLGLADDRQVFCVTHLPQVAAHADRHFVVERSGTGATVRPLVGEERVAELTRMMAGLGESSKGRSHARELLEAAKARRSR